VDLVLQPGPLSHQVSAAGDLPAQHAGPLVRQPHRREEVRRQQLRQDPGIHLVRLRFRLRDRPRLRRVRDHDPRHPGHQRRGDGVAVPGRRQGHLVLRPQGRRPCSQRLGCDADPTQVVDRPVLDHRDLRELTVDVHADVSDHSSAPFEPMPHLRIGNHGAKRHLRIRAHSAAGPVAGAANY
jgi:hypothetical protein